MRRSDCEYDLTYYSHQQLWTLVRDLSSNGWRVSLTALPERRPPDTKPCPGGYRCTVGNPGWNCDPTPRNGESPWDALRRAVHEVVNPAESGG